MDASGEEILHHLVERFESIGITLVFSVLKKQILDVMRNTGLYDELHAENIFPTENMAIR